MSTIIPVVGTNQNVAVAVASAKTTNPVWPTGTSAFVRLASTTACYVAFGEDPTATTSDMIINAGTKGEFFKIQSNFKVAALRVTADGVLSVMAASA